jgi:hypothetical protein
MRGLRMGGEHSVCVRSHASDVFVRLTQAESAARRPRRSCCLGVCCTQCTSMRTRSASSKWGCSWTPTGALAAA